MADVNVNELALRGGCEAASGGESLRGYRRPVWRSLLGV